MTTVSVIIPVYNGAKQVRRAIESALTQTHPAHEIFVVDDGSADNTLDVVAEYPVTVIAQPNSGPGAARNAGAQRATGDWLAFLDHDDAWRPEKTERQLESASDPAVGVIFTPLKGYDGAPITFRSLWTKNVVGFPTGAMVRHRCFREVGGFDPRRALISTEDYNLWLRIALTDWRFAACPQRWFEYTPAENSLSANHYRMALAELASLQSVGELARLDRKDISKRKIAVVNEYVREMIGARNFRDARRFIGSVRVVDIQPSLLIAAWGPRWLLEFRRSLRIRYGRGSSAVSR